MADISKIKPNGANGTEYDVKDATARSALENKANNTQTFTEASTRANIASGETMSTLFGKIKKFFTDLKTVAFTGSYNDLSNKPTIPAAQVQSDWNQTTTSAVDYIKNKPTIPTVPGVVSTSANGLAPKVTNTSNFLKGDGSWSVPSNDKVTVTNRTSSTYNSAYPVIFGTNTGTGTVTEGLQKRANTFTYNPYSEKLAVYQEDIESTLKVGKGGSSNGFIDIYRSTNSYRGEIKQTTDGLTADRDYYLPNESGTLATREYLNSNNYRQIKVYSNTNVSTNQYGTFESKTLIGKNNIQVIQMMSADYRYLVVNQGTQGRVYAASGNTLGSLAASTSGISVIIYYWET